jgi:uncharacterized OB-fold protein
MAERSGTRACTRHRMRVGTKLLTMTIIPGAVAAHSSAARKRFFLKKEAKTFAYWCASCGSVYLL